MTTKDPRRQRDIAIHRLEAGATCRGYRAVRHDRTGLAASPIEIRSAPSHQHRDDRVPNYTRQNAPNLTVGASNRLGLGGLLANRETNPRRRVPRLLPPSSGGRTNTTRILLQTCNTIVPFYRPSDVKARSIPAIRNMSLIALNVVTNSRSEG